MDASAAARLRNHQRYLSSDIARPLPPDISRTYSAPPSSAPTTAPPSSARTDHGDLTSVLLQLGQARMDALSQQRRAERAEQELTSVRAQLEKAESDKAAA
eukprot:5295249-Prymnesium_polylepis.1